MKKPKITEREWDVEVRRYKLDSEDHVCVKNDDMVIAMCGLADSGYLDQSLRDAKAISAVHEMIDVLIKAHEDLVEWNDCIPSSNETEDIIEQIEQALKKAGVQ